METGDQEVDVLEGIGTVLLVEDRPEVLESQVSLLDAYGVSCIGARDEETAWRLLQNVTGPITALVDKALESGEGSGVELLERLVQARPDIRPFLVTAFALGRGELKRMESIDARVLTKGHFNLMEVLSPHYEAMPAGPAEASMPEVRNLLAQQKAEAERYRQKYSTLHSAWKREVASLVDRFREDSVGLVEGGEVWISGRNYSYEELAQNVLNATPLGVALLDLHNQAVEELFKKAKSRR